MYSCSLSGPRDDLLFTIDRAPGNSSLKVVTPSTCRGLTLFFNFVMPAYYVCNAATRSITCLPPYRFTGFDYTAGLGFDDQTMEYKVVRLIKWYSYEKEVLRYDLYTPGADRWRPASAEVPLKFLQYASSAVDHAKMNNRIVCQLMVASSTSRRGRIRARGAVDGRRDAPAPASPASRPRSPLVPAPSARTKGTNPSRARSTIREPPSAAQKSASRPLPPIALLATTTGSCWMFVERL
jgi:hypothetical protein